MKIVVVGGASTYTPELIDGFARLHSTLPVSEVVLVDPAEDRLEIVGSASRRILEHLGRPYQLTTSSDLETSVENAALVLIQLRVGGQDARHMDETVPLGFDCLGQETTGYGGLAKALRTVPVVLDVAERIRQVEPGAWILNFTNPVGIVTRSLLRSGHRAIGLCNVAIAMQYFFANLLKAEPADVSLGHIGLNHLTWETEVRLHGEDVLPKLIMEHAPRIADRVGIAPELITLLGVVPSYYLQFFYTHDAVVRQAHRRPTRASQVKKIESELLNLYEDRSVVSKPAALTSRGGALYSEAAVELAASLVGNAAGTHAVNIQNRGLLDFLPDDAVVETVAMVSDGMVTAGSVPPLRPGIRGLISSVYAYEELALEAAEKGGRERVVEALLAHPLIGQWDLACSLADRLIEVNRDYLPWVK